MCVYTWFYGCGKGREYGFIFVLVLLLLLLLPPILLLVLCTFAFLGGRLYFVFCSNV